MTLRELQYLVALADHGHFGRAAEACHVSQPTLSTQLRKLEETLGVALIERTNKAVQITPVGEEIVAKARQVLDGAEDITVLAQQNLGVLTGTLNLGVIPSLCPYMLPWLLPPLRKAYPDLNLVVHEDLTDNLVEALRAHRIDAAVIALPHEEDDFDEMALFDEPFFVASPADHPVASVPVIKAVDLQVDDLLLLTDGHCLRDQALEVCGYSNTTSMHENADFRATSLETIRQMVVAGMGITLMPALALDDPKNCPFEVRPLSANASRRMGLVWRRSYGRTSDLACLGDLIRKHLPESVAEIPGSE